MVAGTVVGPQNNYARGMWLAVAGQAIVALFAMLVGLWDLACVMIVAAVATAALVARASRPRWRINGGRLTVAAIGGRPALSVPTSEVVALERQDVFPPTAPNTTATFTLVLRSGGRVTLGTQVVRDDRIQRRIMEQATESEARSALALAAALRLPIVGPIERPDLRSPN